MCPGTGRGRRRTAVLSSRFWVGSAMSQKPIVETLVFIGLSPGIMFCSRIDCEFCAISHFPKRADHFARFGGRNERVFCSVEGPRWQMFDLIGEMRIARAANGCNGCKAPGIFDGQLPGGISAHAKSSHIDSVLIDLVFLFDLIQ